MKMDKLIGKIKKNNKSEIPTENLAINDINRGLYETLFAISIYGDTARDEDITRIIINGTDDPESKLYKARKKLYESYVKKLEKGEFVKDGNMVLTKDGKIVLCPKQTI